MILTGENGNIWRKIISSVTFLIKISHMDWSKIENCLRWEMLAIDRLRYYMAYYYNEMVISNILLS